MAIENYQKITCDRCGEEHMLVSRETSQTGWHHWIVLTASDARGPGLSGDGDGLPQHTVLCRRCRIGLVEWLKNA